MEFIELTMRNFTTMVKRNDIKSPQWFAMPNDLLEHPDFYDISGDELKAYVWICGVASKLNTATIRVYPDLCARRIAISRKCVELTIEKLNGKRWDVTHALRGAERVSYATVQNSTEQDTTVQNKILATTAVAILAPTASAIVKSETNVFISGTRETILHGIPEENYARWMMIYDGDKEFIQRELIKAVGYYFDNPQKKPKSKRGWMTALSSWLERGWGFRAKNIRGNTPRIENAVKSAENLQWVNSLKAQETDPEPEGAA